MTTGRRRTEEFYSDGRSRLYRQSVNDRNNDRNNAISKLTYRLAGCSSGDFTNLYTKLERLDFRARAADLFDAGLELELAAQRQLDARPDGDVYALTNPAWPGYVKIGKAILAESRGRGYQTGSPFRDFKVEFALNFPNRSLGETYVLNQLSIHRVISEGVMTEWVKLPLSKVVATIQYFHTQLTTNWR